jgi:hypothetical protein
MINVKLYLKVELYGMNLTKGNIYECEFAPKMYNPQTLQEEPAFVIVKCDDNKWRKTRYSNFGELSELRNIKIDKILKD